ncbi:DUF177 domain-containing protein [Chloroflexota bacterium]
MLQINVSQQLKSPIGSIRDYGVSEIVDIADSSSLVQGDIRLMRTDRSILAKGKLRTEIERTCSRCLDLFNCPLTLNIEEEYFPITDMFTGALLPLPDEPGCFTITENNILDLTEAIRQYALLTTPMKPLCREDCAGLCSTCGGNLNQAPCNCPTEPVDSRWSKLSKLFLVDSEAPVNEWKGTN